MISNKTVTKNSSIKGLNPFVDENGIIRSKSRLENSEHLSYAAKFPIIMPKNNHITTLILRHYHERFYHKKIDTAIAATRQKYWIINVRVEMKKVRNHCQYCKNNAARPQPPMMAALPSYRLESNLKPFTITGADYFGPFTVSIGRRVEKRWGALFTCLTTRAAHIEIAHDLSADAFMLCLANMQHRRGTVKQMYSDNGTNFVGANNELRNLRNRVVNKGIEWTFNPPSSPHFGAYGSALFKKSKA